MDSSLRLSRGLSPEQATAVRARVVAALDLARASTDEQILAAVRALDTSRMVDIGTARLRDVCRLVGLAADADKSSAIESLTAILDAAQVDDEDDEDSGEIACSRGEIAQAMWLSRRGAKHAAKGVRLELSRVPVLGLEGLRNFQCPGLTGFERD